MAVKHSRRTCTDALHTVNKYTETCLYLADRDRASLCGRALSYGAVLIRGSPALPAFLCCILLLGAAAQTLLGLSGGFCRETQVEGWLCLWVLGCTFLIDLSRLPPCLLSQL